MTDAGPTGRQILDWPSLLGEGKYFGQKYKPGEHAEKAPLDTATLSRLTEELALQAARQNLLNSLRLHDSTGACNPALYHAALQSIFETAVQPGENTESEAATEKSIYIVACYQNELARINDVNHELGDMSLTSLVRSVTNAIEERLGIYLPQVSFQIYHYHGPDFRILIDMSALDLPATQKHNLANQISNHLNAMPVPVAGLHQPMPRLVATEVSLEDAARLYGETQRLLTEFAEASRDEQRKTLIEIDMSLLGLKLEYEKILHEGLHMIRGLHYRRRLVPASKKKASAHRFTAFTRPRGRDQIRQWKLFIEPTFRETPLNELKHFYTRTPEEEKELVGKIRNEAFKIAARRTFEALPYSPQQEAIIHVVLDQAARDLGMQGAEEVSCLLVDGCREQIRSDLYARQQTNFRLPDETALPDYPSRNRMRAQHDMAQAEKIIQSLLLGKEVASNDPRRPALDDLFRDQSHNSQNREQDIFQESDKHHEVTKELERMLARLARELKMIDVDRETNNHGKLKSGIKTIHEELSALTTFLRGQPTPALDQQVVDAIKKTQEAIAAVRQSALELALLSLQQSQLLTDLTELCDLCMQTSSHETLNRDEYRLAAKTARQLTSKAPGDLTEAEREYLAQLLKLIETKKYNLASNYDLLTGLPNRSRFFEDIDLRVQGALEGGGRNLGLAYVDLGFLRYFNKVGGRQIGDLALREAGLILEHTALELSQLGYQAQVFRHGGDEFIIMFDLPSGGNVAEAQLTAETVIRESIKGLTSACGKIARRKTQEARTQARKQNITLDWEYDPRFLDIQYGLSYMEETKTSFDASLIPEAEDAHPRLTSRQDMARLLEAATGPSRPGDLEELANQHFYAKELAKQMLWEADAKLTVQKLTSRARILLVEYYNLMQVEDTKDREQQLRHWRTLLQFSGKAILGIDEAAVLEVLEGSVIPALREKTDKGHLPGHLRSDRLSFEQWTEIALLLKQHSSAKGVSASHLPL